MNVLYDMRYAHADYRRLLPQLFDDVLSRWPRAALRVVRIGPPRREGDVSMGFYDEGAQEIRFNTHWFARPMGILRAAAVSPPLFHGPMTEEPRHVVTHEVMHAVMYAAREMLPRVRAAWQASTVDPALMPAHYGLGDATEHFAELGALVDMGLASEEQQALFRWVLSAASSARTARDAWSESDHPRGQPDNAGQFAKIATTPAKVTKPTEYEHGVSQARTEEAIRGYTFESSVVNNFLRTGKKPPADAPFDVEDLVKDLDHALSNARLDRTMFISRGVPSAVASKLLSRAKVGSSITDKGFASFSDNYATAKAFAGRDGWIFTVKALEGTNALDVKKISAAPNEREVLFPRGSRFVIDKINSSSREVILRPVGARSATDGDVILDADFGNWITPDESLTERFELTGGGEFIRDKSTGEQRERPVTGTAGGPGELWIEDDETGLSERLGEIPEAAKKRIAERQAGAEDRAWDRLVGALRRRWSGELK